MITIAKELAVKCLMNLDKRGRVSVTLMDENSKPLNLEAKMIELLDFIASEITQKIVLKENSGVTTKAIVNLKAALTLPYLDEKME